MQDSVFRGLIKASNIFDHVPEVQVLIYVASGPMIGENRQLVTNEPVKFEK